MILAACAIGFCVVIWFSIAFMFRTWGHVTTDGLIFQLSMPKQGAGNKMIAKYLTQAVAPGVAVAAAIWAVCLVMRRRGAHVLLPLLAAVVLAILISVAAVRKAYLEVGAQEYFDYIDKKKGTKPTTFVPDHYVDPKTVSITFPEKKRNLVYIYLESLEVTAADQASGGAFRDNYIPELVRLAKENEDFSGNDEKIHGAVSYSGTTWTVGAMFAETAGLPLQVAWKNRKVMQHSFFSGVTALGDILKKEGYNQGLLIGSDIAFGGRKLYFSQHGGYEIRDYQYAADHRQIPEGYEVWWGYEDAKLFPIAKDYLTELSKKGQPFNLTLLTTDTHFPNGYHCEHCRDEFEYEYGNVFACSSRQVTEFVEWIRRQPFAEDTTIVLSGDHPTMDMDFVARIPQGYERTVYTAYVNAAVKPEDPERPRAYSTFDDFPTTLAALGAEIEGNRLGLGTNLFSSEDTLTETFGRAELEKKLVKRSEFITKLGEY